MTKKGNPLKIKTIQDLANVPTLSLCALTVPCGKYAAQMFETAGITIPETKVTRGQDVKTTLAAVSPGDADAAVVYVSDALRGQDGVVGEDPRRPERHRRLPDQHAQGDGELGDRGRVREVRAVEARAEGAEAGRLHAAPRQELI